MLTGVAPGATVVSSDGGCVGSGDEEERPMPSLLVTTCTAFGDTLALFDRQYNTAGGPNTISPTRKLARKWGVDSEEAPGGADVDAGP
jgi:hypothetical protein